MKQKINIEISGVVNSGKSSIAYLIQEALEKVGIKTELIDAEPPLRKVIDKVLECIADKTEVVITLKQLNRQMIINKGVVSNQTNIENNVGNISL